MASRVAEVRRLVDAREFVFPLVLGDGRRLFPDGSATTKLTLAGTEPYDSGVVHLAYQLNDPR